LLLAGLLLVLLGGGGGLNWAWQRARLVQGGDEELARVGYHLPRWELREAETALLRAEGLVPHGGPADLCERVGQMRGHWELMRRLEQIRLARATWVEDRFDDATADRDYTTLFQECGLVEEDTLAVAARIQGSPIRAQLVAALDDWATATNSGPRRAWILEVARRADPGEWSDQFRDPAVWSRPKDLERLARKAPVELLTPQLLSALGTVLLRQKRDPVPLLRAAQQRHPTDFWIAFNLGNALIKSKAGEAEGYYRVALAVRPDTSPVHYNLGIALYEQGKVEEAVGHFRKALDLRNAKVHYNLGVALRAQGQVEEAVGHFRKALDLDPRHADAHYNLGLALRDQGQVEGAIRHYRKALDLEPRHVNAHIGLGRAMHEQGKVDEAVGHIRKALDLDPRHVNAHIGLGVALRAQGQVEEGVGHYRKAIEFDPRNAKAHYNLGVALYEQGKVDEAVGHFRKALDLDPRNAGAHSNLGVALRAQGQAEEAVGHFRKALDLEPRNAIAHYNLGIGLHAQGKVNEAVGHYRKAVEFDPRNAGAHSNLSIALLAQGKVDEAVGHSRKALDLDPRNAGAHSNLGLALRAQGQVEEAVGHFRKALDLEPRNAIAHYNLGIGLHAQGKVNEAVGHYRKAVEFDPRHAKAHYNLGAALYAQGKVDEAIRHYRTVLDLEPRNVKALVNLGIALNKQGEVEEAIRHYRTVLDLEPRNAIAHYNLGIALLARGKVDEAIRHYHQAIALVPTHAEAHCNLGGVLQSQGRFAEALRLLHRGHELGCQRPGWKYPSARWVRECRRLLELQTRLPDLLAGKISPASEAERLEYARCCSLTRQHVAAARLYARAFTADPGLAGDLRAGHRNAAACAASLAAAGQGQDAAGLEEKERADWRKRALGWLREDLARWTAWLDKDPVRTRSPVQMTLRHWQQNPDLAGLRDPARLARLPAEERAACERLWADVAALLARAEPRK
jgi:Flp pilus assembly protein TadD